MSEEFELYRRFGNFDGEHPLSNTLCAYCGRRYGDHYGYECPEEIEETPMLQFWECYVEGTDGGRHYKWYSLLEAQNEAERLARLPDVQGKTVYLFECVGKCKAEHPPVKWEVPR
jgi:hypothetical protein